MFVCESFNKECINSCMYGSFKNMLHKYLRVHRYTSCLAYTILSYCNEHIQDWFALNRFFGRSESCSIHSTADLNVDSTLLELSHLFVVSEYVFHIRSTVVTFRYILRP